MSVLTFLCLHIFRHQKQQKEKWGWGGLEGGGGGGLALKRKKRKEKKKKSDRHAITASDMFRLIQAPLSYLLRQFSIRAREVVFGPRRVFDEDIFDLPTSLSLSLATSHKPEAFRPPLTAMTIAAANLAKSADGADKRPPPSFSLARRGRNLAGVPRHRRDVPITVSLFFFRANSEPSRVARE